MAITLQDNFESGLGNWPSTDFGGGSGSVSAATDQFVSSSHAMKVICPDLSSPCYVATGDGICADAGTRMSVQIRFSNLPASAEMACLGIGEAGFNSSIFLLAITPAGKLRVYGDSGVIGAAGPTTLAINTWYRLAWSWVITSSSNWTLKIYINGVLELTRTQADQTLGLVGTSEVWATVNNASGTREALTVWYDDIYVDDGTNLADPLAATADLNALVGEPISGWSLL